MNVQRLKQFVPDYKLSSPQRKWAVAAIVFSAFDFLIQLANLPGSFGSHPLDIYALGLAVKRIDNIAEMLFAASIVWGSAATIAHKAFGPVLAKTAAWLSLIPASLQCALYLFMCNDRATYAVSKKVAASLLAGQPDDVVTAALQQFSTLLRGIEVTAVVCFVFQSAYFIGTALTMSKVYAAMRIKLNSTEQPSPSQI